jgi:hypothetical protein
MSTTFVSDSEALRKPFRLEKGWGFSYLLIQLPERPTETTTAGSLAEV